MRFSLVVYAAIIGILEMLSGREDG